MFSATDVSGFPGNQAGENGAYNSATPEYVVSAT